MPTLRMTAPKDFSRVSVEGFVYDVDKDGEIEAHVSHQAHLEAHGFTAKAARASIEITTEKPAEAPKPAADAPKPEGNGASRIHPKAAKAAAAKAAAEKAEQEAAAEKAAEAEGTESEDGEEPAEDAVLG